MKNKFQKLLFLITVLLMSNSAFSQNCVTTNTVLNTQADIDTFVATYSGTCNTVDAALLIGGSGSDITDISGLSFLTTITGVLVINNTNLITTNGLHNIETINDNLSISNNNILEHVLFSSLETISGYVSISDVSIVSIDFPNLTTVNDPITIKPGGGSGAGSNNVFIENLPNLATVNFANLLDAAIFEVRFNTNLTTLNFANLSSTGALNIDSNTNLTTLDFANLSSSSLIFNLNTNLTTLNFANLSSTNNLIFTSNTSLQQINLPLLSNTTLNSINISDNSVLTDIDFLNNILVVEDDLVIANNTFLNDCCILTNFITGSGYVGGSITIFANNTDCNSIASIITSCSVTQVDTDTDNVIDTNDNCINTTNPNQEDSDNDGVGDVCDNCPNDANTSQEDANNNGIGDACEASGTGADAGSDVGGLGVGTNTPQSQFEVTKGDVFIKNIHRGVIMKSPSGKCFRFQPNETGMLKSIEITCPDN